MKITLIGAGFTGLTAALRLLQVGHQVTILEKEKIAGGLASGFKKPSWQWSVEKCYHHFFTNDQIALKLAHELGQKLENIKPDTDVLVKERILTMDSPLTLLNFSSLPFFDRLRMGLILLYLKCSLCHQKFEGQKVLPWIRKMMGKKATELIWEPLLVGKFGDFKEDISLTWFWARIKKRTIRLIYPVGGFDSLTQKLVKEIERLGGEILFGQEVISVKSNSEFCSIKTVKGNFRADKVISTIPTPIFLKMTKNLPDKYIKRLSSITHLTALTLILTLKKPFLKSTYWLNITETNFPFLALVEHTNFISPKYYGGEYLLYIGNYLPPNHPYLKMTPEQVLKIYLPFLKKINPNCQLLIINYQLFSFPFAQPVVRINYQKLKPDFKTPLKNVYLANLDMVYPWDRGVNFAIELGEKAAKIVNNDCF
jgi:protoporphyrinogen oxidase